MDLKTLLSGFRPIRPAEHLDKAFALERAFHDLQSYVPDVQPVVFAAGISGDILVHRFGSPANDINISHLLAELNYHSPIPDVYLAALLNALTMQLTYQGRYLAAYPEPEIVIAEGLAPASFAACLLNGNRILGVSLGDTDTPFDFIPQVDQSPSLSLNRSLISVRTAESCKALLGSQARSIGLVVLTDEGDPGRLASALDGASTQLSNDTFYVLAGEAERIAGAAASLIAENPEASVQVRFYNSGSPSGFRRRGLIVVTNTPIPPKLAMPDATPIRAKFIASRKPGISLETGGRVRAQFFGDAFRSPRPEGAGFEIVNIRPPKVVRSSGPLPPYSRDMIEQPLLIEHAVSVIKGGGVVYSKDFRHSTYYYVTDQNELIEDVIEHGVFHQSPAFLDSQLEAGGRYSLVRDKEHFRIRGAAIPLCFAPTAHEFHSHFLLQCFPRVLLGRELCPDATYLVPWNLKRYQRELMHLVGVPAEKMVPILPDSIVYCDELYAPNLWPAVFSRYSERIYSEIMERTPKSDISFPDRILISREARVAWRNLVNFDTVSRLLCDKFNFEVVSPDKLSLVDEINLFMKSRLIAGAEGAGLYNCCFAGSNSGVLNLADQDYVMYIVGSMAAIRGFDVGYVFGDSYLAETDLRRRAGHSDFVINPMLLESAVAEMLDTQPRRI